MRKSWLRYLMPVLLATVLFLGCGRKPGEKLYHEALAEWEAGNYVRARTLLEKSIRRRTGSAENAEAYNRLGLLLQEMGEPAAAVEAFSESCRMNAGQYGVLCNLGVALSAQNDFTAADRAFRDAALMQPDDPRPLACAGMAYTQNRNWNDAGRNLRLAIGRMPNNLQLQTALALVELHTDGADAALKRLQSILKQNPDCAPAIFNTASIYRHWFKNQVEAKRWFELYLQKSGDGPFAVQAHSQLQALSETPKLVFTAPAVPNRKNAESYFQKALIAHKAGKTPEAIRWYIRTVEEDDSYEQAFYNLGLAYYAEGKMDLAGEAFARAVKISPAFIDARYNTALVEHRLGRNDRALRELEIVLTQQPDYQPARDLQALIRK